MTFNMKTMFVVACVLLLVPFVVNGQTVDEITARFYNVGAPDPISSYSFLSGTFVCGQTPPPPDASNTINPTTGATFVWDDPDSPGQVCTHSAAAGSPIFALPIPGAYEATIEAFNEMGASGESARSPFDTLNPPNAPTGNRVIQ